MIALEKKTLPLLVLRDVIIFPGTIAPIFIGREKSLNALLAAKRIDDGQHILLTTQKKQDIEEPGSTPSSSSLVSHSPYTNGAASELVNGVMISSSTTLQ